MANIKSVYTILFKYIINKSIILDSIRTFKHHKIIMYGIKKIFTSYLLTIQFSSFTVLCIDHVMFLLSKVSNAHKGFIY